MSELSEVRRVEGMGEIAQQEATWQQHLSLELDMHLLSLSNPNETNEELWIEEEQP